jgi:hypothetical protein
MATSSAQLLRLLEPSVRPAFGQTGPASRGTAPLDQQSFAQLLGAASNGQIHSGRQVEMACEPTPPLSASQMERLASAGDVAEAAGARTAMMLIDGRGFVMDVQNRTITAEMSSTASSRMAPVDLAMHVAADDESQLAGILPLPGSGVVSSSLTRLLSSTSSR